MWDFSVVLGLLLSIILAVFFIFKDAASKLAAFDNINNDMNIVVEQLSIVPNHSNGPNSAKNEMFPFHFHFHPFRRTKKILSEAQKQKRVFFSAQH